jgi:peroxiredoxin family protein
MTRAKSSRKLAVICSKGSLDMAYPGLLLANAARMAGVDALMYFTFWGLDIITDAKVDHLHVSLVGNPSTLMPAMIAGLPGMEGLASLQMQKELERLEIPRVRQLLEMVSDAGCELYACQLGMDMFKLKRLDLVPQVKSVISAMDFVDLSEGAQVIFI